MIAIGDAMRKSALAAILVSTVLLLAISGCTMSKSKYESLVKSTLERIEEDSSQVQKDRKKLVSAKSQPSSKETEDLRERQIAILERGKARLEKINPPDDFFIGHSDLVEFMDLLVEANKSGTASGNKADGARQVSAVTQSKALEALGASTQAFSKAVRELPFLEYELNQTFSEIMNDFQSEAFQPPKT